MPDTCTSALALLDGHKSRTLKLTWDMYSRYQKKVIYFGRAYFRILESIKMQMPDICAPALPLPDAPNRVPSKLTLDMCSR